MIKLLVVFFTAACLLASCSKDGFISSPDARLIAAVDTLRFDTVFTSVGSITQAFTLVNDNSRKLMISSIKLGGGTTSPFKINVNGTAGTTFSSFEINASDSIYIFVKVTIDPTIATNPFVLNDSIEIQYNGTSSKVYLQAFGQNARFLKNETITANTTWNNSLPYVIQDNLVVAAGATLTIEKGTRVFVNARAAIIVNGSLQVNGEKAPANHVVFRGDRLDTDYRDLPGGWPGIVFTQTSSNNAMTYADVLNAYQALVVIGGASQVQPKLQLQQCNISNAYDIGLYAYNSNVEAINCLISQCGNEGVTGVGGSNIILTAGGRYHFEYCTVTTYANYYQSHKQPSCFISNSDGAVTAGLMASFTNCILYGVGGKAEDELVVKMAASDQVLFSSSIYKVKADDPAGVTFANCLKNTDPLFDSINVSRQEYSFRLRDESPARDAGQDTSTDIDLEGNPRPAGIRTDMGCYEKQ